MSVRTRKVAANCFMMILSENKKENYYRKHLCRATRIIMRCGEPASLALFTYVMRCTPSHHLRRETRQSSAVIIIRSPLPPNPPAPSSVIIIVGFRFHAPLNKLVQFPRNYASRRRKSFGQKDGTGGDAMMMRGMSAGVREAVVYIE